MHSGIPPQLFSEHALSNGEDVLDAELFSSLPSELIHHIFLMGSISSIAFARTLSLVSQWTLDLVIPYLEPTLVMRDRHYRLKPRASALSTLHDPLHYTKNVWLRCGSKSLGDIQETTHALFSRCHNAKRIALTGFSLMQLATSGWQTDALWSLDVTVLDELFPEDGAPFSDVAPPLKLFQRISHLRYPVRDALINLHAFSGLTHIAVDVSAGIFPTVFDLVARITSQVLALEMIVLVAWCCDPDSAVGFLPSFRETVTVLRQHDNRVYLWRETFRQTDTFLTWMHESEGGLSIWERAQEYSRSVGLLLP